MWDVVASCIKEMAREMLGVSIKRSLWQVSRRVVKGNVEAKKGVYAKWVESKDQKEKRKNREEYNIAQKEAKLVVTKVKIAAFQSLYAALEGKSRDKKLYGLAKARERRTQHLDQVKQIKNGGGEVLIRIKCQSYFHKLLNKESDISIVLGNLDHFDRLRDYGYCRCVEVEKVKGFICRMHRGRAARLDEILVDFRKCTGGVGVE